MSHHAPHHFDQSPIPPQPPGDEVSPEEFLNRELGWLAFNRRVLHEACDNRTPLLERVQFLSIFTSNLDEFFQKRVGGFKRQVAEGIFSLTADGLSPGQQLLEIRRALLPDLARQAACYGEQVQPALAREGLLLLQWEDLSAQQQQQAADYFHREVFPVLTPLAVDPGHPFPFISNLSTSLGISLAGLNPEQKLFARVKVPQILPQWLRLASGPGEEQRFISLQEIIRHNLGALFPSMTVLNVMPFRVTRNADVERDEEDVEDLLEMIAQEVRQRRFLKVVRLEHGPNPDPWMLEFLVRELELSALDVYELPGLLDYRCLNEIAASNIPRLKYSPWTPLVPPVLNSEEADIFSVIREGDLLVHHPYESFGATVERFIRSAAQDPKVAAIKMTLYRTGDESSFMPMLIQAAEAGKQVVVLVELKARFDEYRNLQLAQALEKAGVHVVYGIVGLKTHTKTTLVVRREADGMRCYAHIGTGNYHAGNARLYTDLGLLTCDPELTADLVELFHYLTGRSLQRQYRKLLIAPVNMKERFQEMIQREIDHAQAGRPARIIAKMNSLEHRGVSRALYRASQAGVAIDLIVRGFCCLRPGVKGMSENIRVISVIGRFLEHSRIFYFRNGAAEAIDGEFYIGSADWMYRNLLARIEAITPLQPRAFRERCWEILQIMLEDQRQAWEMDAAGVYHQRQPKDPARDLGTHQNLMNLALQYCSPRGDVPPAS